VTFLNGPVQGEEGMQGVGLKISARSYGPDVCLGRGGVGGGGEKSRKKEAKIRLSTGQ